MLDLQSTSQGLAEAFLRQLGSVEEIFTRQLESDLPAVSQLANHVSRYRGKMLRPSLTILSGLTAVEGDLEQLESDSLQRLAAVIEMIHMATLVHDDVLDDADERRGTETVNNLRGNELAVMLGDYLISNAFHLCSTIGDPSLNEALGKTTNTLCEGELVQLHHRDDLSLDLQTYMEIVRRKTAVLVGACGRLGAQVMGGSPELSTALELYGEHLGTAFQIRDDVLDLEGDVETVGKSVGRDLEKGKLTLPVILLLETVPENEFQDIVEIIRSKDATALKARIHASGTIEGALEIARDEISKGKEAVAGKISESLQPIFEELANSVLTRSR